MRPTHAKFTLADKMQATIGIMTILYKQCIKLSVESLMWSILFLSDHDAVDFVVLGSFQYRI
jgi:hypothetical protein